MLGVDGTLTAVPEEDMREWRLAKLWSIGLKYANGSIFLVRYSATHYGRHGRPEPAKNMALEDHHARGEVAL